MKMERPGWRYEAALGGRYRGKTKVQMHARKRAKTVSAKDEAECVRQNRV